MFFAFADTMQSYAYSYCTKIALKEMLLKRVVAQTNFRITSWLGLQNFLMEFYNNMKSQIPDMVSIFLFL